jgi:iron complex transport system substrate-binding protein
VKAGHLYFVPPDILQRHSPRILDGAEQFCERVERARQVPGAK